MPSKTIPLSQVLESSLLNPGIRAEYDALAEEFEVAQMIIDMRKAAKLTQRELADRLGMKQPQLARLETGKQLPRLDTLANLASQAGYILELKFTPQPSDKDDAEPLPEFSYQING
jgi:transcriptional regulator with XRE-family HTH domain